MALPDKFYPFTVLSLQLTKAHLLKVIHHEYSFEKRFSKSSTLFSSILFSCMSVNLLLIAFKLFVLLQNLFVNFSSPRRGELFVLMLLFFAFFLILFRIFLLFSFMFILFMFVFSSFYVYEILFSQFLKSIFLKYF